MRNHLFLILTKINKKTAAKVLVKKSPGSSASRTFFNYKRQRCLISCTNRQNGFAQ